MEPNDDLLDKTVAEIQEAILNEARRIYSETVIDHFLHPRNLGPMEDADGLARVTGPCGDTMSLFLRVRQGKIAEARFMTDGCASTIACGSMVTQLVEEKPIAEALKISPVDVIEALGGLPASSMHCAVLAARTLQEAISNLLSPRKGGQKERKTHG
jgi:nitrogen fixation NifU-like protein